MKFETLLSGEAGATNYTSSLSSTFIFFYPRFHFFHCPSIIE